MERNVKITLQKLLFTSKNGAVSVYLKEKIGLLRKYYIGFGFKSEVIDRTITLEGGFEYYCIPPSEIIETIERQKN